MAFSRPGAPAPTASGSAANAQALANRSIQNAARAGSTALQAASPSVPVEITAADGQLLNREGSIVYDGEAGGEVLLGGWAKVYRKDRTRASYEEVKLSEYNTGKSLWAAKPATMIRKVALVHALREAFPSTFGSLYDESEVRVDAESTAREVEPEELPVLDPYAGTRRPRKTAGTLIPSPEEPAAEGAAEDPFAGGEPV